MKKLIIYLVIVLITVFLIGCDRSYHSYLTINSSNEILLSKTDEFSENTNNLYYSNNYLNDNHIASYKNLSNAIIYSFFIKSSRDINAKLSLKLNDANNYLLDYIRIAIEIDEEFIVYKYFDKNEIVHDEDNEYENTNYFISETDVFKEYDLPLIIDDSKNVIIYIWVEETELYDKNGNRLTGRKDHSNDISQIDLLLSID